MTRSAQTSDKELQLGLLEIIARYQDASLSDLIPAISKLFGLPEIILSGREEAWLEKPIKMSRELHSEGIIHCIVKDNNYRGVVSQITWDDRDHIFLELTGRDLTYLQNREVPPSKYYNKQSRQRTKKTKHSRSIREIVTEKERSYRRPRNDEEAREKIAASIAARRGQREFRRTLLITYGKRCLITGPCIEDILEAAHIRPYSEGGTFNVSNGLLLRADIHTLFDLGLIAIDPVSMTAVIAKELQSTSYTTLSGQKLHLSENRENIPNKVALKERLELMTSKL